MDVGANMFVKDGRIISQTTSTPNTFQLIGLHKKELTVKQKIKP